MTQQRTVRGALIGCGFFAENQMRAWRDLHEMGKGVEIVALCDRDPQRLAYFRDLFGVEAAYTEAETLFAAFAGELDFVDIATTTPSHAALVPLAARHGVDIICQKPFAGSLENASRLIAQCSASRVSLGIHENFRWQHAVRQTIETLRSGRIGRPFFGRISYRSGFDVYAAQPYLARAERFILEDLGIHVLDIARALFGEVARLSCETTRINAAIAGEDVATLMLQHDDGITSVVDCSYATRLADDPFPQSLIEVDGVHGSLRLRQDFVLEIHDTGGHCVVQTVRPEPPAWSESPWVPIQASVLAFQADWLEAYRQNRPIETRGEDNYNTLALVEAAYEAAATHQSVIPERWNR
ncbi:Gfo/Idh/MocA family oxidoreductase [Salinicola corii]|uniref:Gfo/Idh/MocA family oxidoreductase n=1 Tax=Salinicola corii TaxID=2606937 RepID=A0A640WF65_9GAMM|nr:Gfo/Idh/MocA family oxidoreductase [Salinicola corii]KAA0018795.1 Gfo/Idh/MocA family oxidoreductase [Salinicola corii]